VRFIAGISLRKAPEFTFSRSESREKAFHVIIECRLGSLMDFLRHQRSIVVELKSFWNKFIISLSQCASVYK
jgi:hypothetical protein